MKNPNEPGALTYKKAPGSWSYGKIDKGKSEKVGKLGKVAQKWEISGFMLENDS